MKKKVVIFCSALVEKCCDAFDNLSNTNRMSGVHSTDEIENCSESEICSCSFFCARDFLFLFLVIAAMGS